MAAAVSLPGADGLVERVAALLPMIRKAAPQAERDRKPVDAVIEALEESRVFRAYAPV